MRGWLARAMTPGTLLLVTGCAGVLRHLEAPDRDGTQETVRLHSRMAEEAFRLHQKAHEQGVRETERVRDLPPPPTPPMDPPPPPEPPPVP